MITNKIRGSKRVKAVKLSKNLERLYKERKCRECAVVVTRMDFAKILGKFTKVKIQYESSTTPKTKHNTAVSSTNSVSRIKSNENGMVMVHRNAMSNAGKGLSSSKKNKVDSPRVTPNILKENNRLKKTNLRDKTLINNNCVNQSMKSINLKEYGIVFEDPLMHNNNNDLLCKITLTDLLSQIDDSILPTEEWCIDFFPKKGEPKDDKVYDRIAAELEDLMYNEKPTKPNEKIGNIETKVDEFPSIMDILNDSSSDNKTSDQNSCLEFKSNLESSDVEAMLLGESNPTNDTPVNDTTAMDVDNTAEGNLIGNVNQLDDTQESVTPEPATKLPADTCTADSCQEIENPQSPSILDEALKKGIEEHLPANPEKTVEELEPIIDKTDESETKKDEEKPIEKVDLKETETKIIEIVNESKNSKTKQTWASAEGITHLVFKKTRDGECFKTVTCPKNLKYDIEIGGKMVEFIGAPKLISSLEDLRVLLQIVNESELDSLYVLY